MDATGERVTGERDASGGRGPTTQTQASGSIPPQGLVLREAVAEDAGVVAEIEAASFSNPWHADTFRSLIRQKRAFIPVAELPGEGIVGYAVFWWAVDQGELANVAVREGFQRRGIGAALLEEVIRYAGEKGVESLFLEVRVSNEGAQRMYLDRGFKQVAVRKDYYQKPREDALILMKTLEAEE